MSTTFRRTRTGLYVPRGTAYVATALALGPLLLLGLDETSGTSCADATGNGHTGTVTSGTTMGVSTILGLGTAFTFNGTSQDVDVPYFSALDTLLPTLACWIKTTNANAGIPLGRSGDTNSPYWMQISGGKLLGVTKSPSVSIVTGATTVSDGAWHHIAFVRESAVPSPLNKVYVDGVIDATPLATSGLAPQSLPGAGISVASRGTGTFFAGSIDAPAVWNFALTGAQIAALAAAR